MLSYVLLPVTLMFAFAAPTTLAAESVPSSTLVPPALLALEQKMLLIHFNTARVSAVFGLGELGAPAGGGELGADADKCNSLISTTTGTERLSPPEATAISEIGGVTVTKQISIGRTLYTYTPSAEPYDGGRPWVSSVKALVLKSSTSSPLSVISTLSEDQPTTSTGFFQRLIEEINGASKIQEVGPAVVDGQPVSEYTATVSIAKLIAARLSQKQIDVAKKNKLFKSIAKATLSLELFITSSGLPIRMIDIIGPRNEGIGVEQDILATDIPLTIHAPPPSKTIGQTRLRKLERQYAKKHSHQPLMFQSPLGGAAPSNCPSKGNEESGRCVPQSTEARSPGSQNDPYLGADGTGPDPTPQRSRLRNLTRARNFPFGRCVKDGIGSDGSMRARSMRRVESVDPPDRDSGQPT